MGKVPEYAKDPQTGKPYTTYAWRSLSKSERARVTLKGRTYKKRKQRPDDAPPVGPPPLPPPEAWTGDRDAWNALPKKRRQVIRKRFAKRVFSGQTTFCPMNKEALKEYLDLDIDPCPQSTRQLLDWDGHTSYYRNLGVGRRYGFPYMTMTTANRGARAVCAQGTGLRDGDLENCQPAGHCCQCRRRQFYVPAGFAPCVGLRQEEGCSNAEGHG